MGNIFSSYNNDNFKTINVNEIILSHLVLVQSILLINLIKFIRIQQKKFYLIPMEKFVIFETVPG